MNRRNEIRAGILTFHCSHNFGAMLQAYGLKSYLNANKIKTDLVCYEPFFLMGRHWWFPYIPMQDKAGRRKLEKNMWRAHRNMGRDFFRQYRNFEWFKKKYLTGAGRRKLFCAGQLSRLPYQCYIVGSDQIWNPDITFGLRSVYFGAFENRRKKKVIAYGASLGGTSMDAQYEEEFSRLLQCVDVISMREQEAIPYVKQFYQKEMTAVLDPVFLLSKETWQKIEKKPDQERYILVYAAESNQELYEYALELSREKGLPALILRSSKWETDQEFLVDYTAGPAEFLGYVHGADYVVTNSFHGVAFSIIYQKKFLAFLHSDRGERTRNILAISGLNERLYQKEEHRGIDADIDWKDVQAKMKESVKHSEDFLTRHILSSDYRGE